MKLLSMALVATSITIAAPVALAQANAASEMAKTTSTMVTAKVNGMVCDFCARAVSKVFGREDAVETVHVDLDHGEIHVTLKPGAVLSDERVAQLVKKSGYDLVSIDREAI